jgi:hypothetical protein
MDRKLNRHSHTVKAATPMSRRIAKTVMRPSPRASRLDGWASALPLAMR